MINFYICITLINSYLHLNYIVLLRYYCNVVRDDTKIFVKPLCIRVYNVCVTPIQTNLNIEKTTKKVSKLTNILKLSKIIETTIFFICVRVLSCSFALRCCACILIGKSVIFNHLVIRSILTR